MKLKMQLEDAEVVVYWTFERDEHGVYNTGVDKVMYQGVDLVPVLSEDTLNELDGRAIQLYEAQEDD